MSFMSEALAKFKGAWATLPAETKGEIMQELGVPDGFNPFPVRRPDPIDVPSAGATEGQDEEGEDIIDAEFKEVRRGSRNEDLDDTFGV